MPNSPELDPVSALMRIAGAHWVLTLALADRPSAEPAAVELAPYPAPLFYALVEPNTIGLHAAPLLVFTSDPNSHHGQLAGPGPTPAAAGIYLETETFGELRGVQLRGTLLREEGWTDVGAAGLRTHYLARHSVAEQALAAGGHRLYALIVTWAKLTDNRLGFGVHPVARFDDACSERRG